MLQRVCAVAGFCVGAVQGEQEACVRVSCEFFRSLIRRLSLTAREKAIETRPKEFWGE